MRLTTMLENPPRVRIWSTLLLIIVPPFQGVLLGFIPIFVAQMSMSLLIKRVPASRDPGAASMASGGVVEPSTPSTRRYPRFSPSESGRVARSAPRPSERPKLGHDVPLMPSTVSREQHAPN